MLLNLLTAVLSTSHSKVQESAESEFKVTRAPHDSLLPPCSRQASACCPFQLNPVGCVLAVYARGLLLDCSWNGNYSRLAKKTVSCAVFWFVLGPVAVAGGTLLWISSAFYSGYFWHNRINPREATQILFLDLIGCPQWRPVFLGYLVIPMWCVVGAPVWLVALWLLQPLVWNRKAGSREGVGGGGIFWFCSRK